MVELAKIDKVNVRDIWPDEAVDFTPWLANNLDVLGDELGLALELQQSEASVGRYSLDILATDLNGSRPVVIENQLEATDHDHLGKLLTYAAGFNANIVVWLTKEFRDEHREALDWLNQRTGEETLFFGVVVELWKIDQSRAAPHFNVVAMPNSWSKQVHPPNPDDLTETQERYVQFWKPLLEKLKVQHGWDISTVCKYPEYLAGSGFGYISRRMRLTWENEARVELWIGNPDADWNEVVFDRLQESREQIEADLGMELTWDRMDGYKASRILVSRNGSTNDSEERLDEIRTWMIEHVRRFGNPAFHPHLGNVLSRMEVDT